MKIAFVWTNGVKDTRRFSHWNDGLRAAMRIIQQNHEVSFHEPYEDLPEVDWILFWEAACTHDAQEWGDSYKKVMHSPQKKALLFAGGPIKYEWLSGFDHVFYESECNGEELRALGIPCSQAFGVNTDVFKPMNAGKDYEVVTHGTCASWKRQWLAGQAFHDRALVFGRKQPTDPYPFEECIRQGAKVMEEQPYHRTALFVNTAHVALNCADKWGGGQRQTLEAMACGLPVVVMSDSEKNMEYIRDGGIGVITDPHVDSIIASVAAAKELKGDPREYVMSKWTPQHYADNLMKILL